MKRYGSPLMLILAALQSDAALHETAEQIQRRYGPPVTNTTWHFGPQTEYRPTNSPVSVDVVFRDGRSVAEHIRPHRAGWLDLDRCERLIHALAPPQTWEREEKAGTYRWFGSSNHFACWFAAFDPNLGLLIMSEPALESWQAKRMAEESVFAPGAGDTTNSSPRHIANQTGTNGAISPRLPGSRPADLGGAREISAPLRRASRGTPASRSSRLR